MPNTPANRKLLNLNKISRLQQFVQSVQASEMTGFLSNVVNSRWFDWFAISGFSIKLATYLFKFITAKNKNIYQTGLLGWGILQAAITGFAIAGTLIAATSFALLTPAIIVGSLALDTIRNITLMFWHVGKLAKLRFSLRKQLITDPIARAKYLQLKTELIAKVKDYAIGSVLGLIMTSATAVAFLFPHIGLGAIAAAGLVVGGIKITLSMALGVLAVGAPMVPVFVSAIKSAYARLKSVFGNQKKNSLERAAISQDKSSDFIISATLKAEKTFSAQADAQKFTQDNTKPVENTAEPTITFLESAKQHKLVNGSKRKLRPAVVYAAIDEQTAKDYLVKEIAIKVKQLTEELESHNIQAKFQHKKREMKLFAMLIIYLNLTSIDLNGSNTEQTYLENVCAEYEQKLERYLDNTGEPLSQVDSPTTPSTQNSPEVVLEYIDRYLPGVNQSFFTNHSDTEDIIKAYQVYTKRFGTQSQPAIESIPTVSIGLTRAVSYDE